MNAWKLGATPDPIEAHAMTTLLNDPTASIDSSLGPGYQIGVAARGTGADGHSRAYEHFSYNNIQGVYQGAQVPDQNNHLSRLDY